MIVPDEFKQLASGFYQGSAEEAPTTQQWIDSALRHVNAKQKAVVKRFLSELLDGSHDDAELERVWQSTSPDYFITGPGGLRGFLAMIRDSID